MPDLDSILSGYPVLDLLKPDLELEHRNDGLWVKDRIRKSWLKLTPEEWVRQHAIYWLIKITEFPEGLLSIERSFSNRSLQRADIVGFGRNGNPFLLVECKAAYEPINSETARQALQYNKEVKAPFVWLTNGLSHTVLGILENGHFEPIQKLPKFEEMADYKIKKD
jgi:hypothetical protein